MLGLLARKAINMGMAVPTAGTTPVLPNEAVPNALQKSPDAVLKALRDIPLWRLGKTATGHPRRPLDLRSDTPVEPF